MRKKSILSTLCSLIFVLILSTNLYGAVSFWGVRGDVWALLDQIEKEFYLQGMVDVLIMHDGILINTQMPFDSSIENFVTGIDKHYEDYRNQLIPAAWLLEVVGKEITGTSGDEITTMLQELRLRFSNTEN